MQVIQQKKQSPLTVADFLGASVVKTAFPNISKLLLLYLLVPQSEAVIESGFSCMKMIMAYKRTTWDSEKFEGLMRLPKRNKSFYAKEVNYFTEIWQSCCNRRIIAKEIYISCKGCRTEGSVNNSYC